MSARPRPSSIRSMTAKLAVAGVASLASVLLVAPMAVADDVPTTDPNELPETPAPTDATPDPAAVVPTPTEEAPSGETQAPAAKAAAAEDEAAEDEIVADFGMQKFRVGVKVADGSHLPAGQNTAGSTFTITISGPNGSYTDTCTTDASTLDPAVSATATYCLPNQFGRAGKLAANPEVDPKDDLDAPEQLFFLQPGETATISQTTAVHGLIKSTNTHVIEPCVVSEPGNYACDGEAYGTLQTKVLYSNPLPASDPSTPATPGADPDDAVLPDTGGSNLGLLALSILMLTGGGWLTAKGRRVKRLDASIN